MQKDQNEDFRFQGSDLIPLCSTLRAADGCLTRNARLRPGMEGMAAQGNLAYIICFDAPGSESNRYLTRMLVSSLLRTYFTGDIVVFRNSVNPLFLVERKGLQEVYVDAPQLGGMEGAEDAWCWKYKVAELLDTRGYDKVLFLDADMLALRNIDHLLEGDWDIAYMPTRGWNVLDDSFAAYWAAEEISDFRVQIAGLGKGTALPLALTGANSGTLAVRAEIYHEVMATWRAIDEGPRRVELGFRDQASWNALLARRTDKSGAANGKNQLWKAAAFPEGEIQFPMFLDPEYRNYTKAALTHNCGGDTLVKIQFTFGLYMRTFFCDPTGLFFSILET
jgi:hypothetical protein